MSPEVEPRAAILAAAAGEIARHGFHGMSMRELARAAGKGLSSLYTYFASKEEILFALHVEAFDALIAGGERAIAPEHDPVERLRAFVLAHVRYVEADRDRMRVLVRESGSVAGAGRGVVRGRKDRYFAIGRELVRAVMLLDAGDGVRPRRRVDPAELDRATYALFGMMNWMYAWHDARHHGGAEEVASTIVRIAVDGLRGGEAAEALAPRGARGAR